MASTFTWLDNSEHDRRRALDVIDLFQRQGTLDELGIGTVRDAIAELLAPGLSTIQTRARYFLIVPWVYLRLERLRCSSADIAKRARNNELRVAEALSKCVDSRGTIGLQAGRALQRLPSAVYWGGLGILGIRLFARSQESYHRSLDRFYVSAAHATSLREDPEAEIFVGANWHPHIPPPPAEFPDQIDFLLSAEEASYLQDRFLARTPGSLVAFLSQRGATFEGTRFPWNEPLLSTYSEPLRSQVEHARCFSEVMHGAALLYNLMLSEALDREDWIADYEKRLADWQALIGERERALQAWDRRSFWAMVESRKSRIPLPTHHFITQWVQFALDVRPLTLGTPAQRTLIRDREALLKRNRARLLHREYLQTYSGSAGADPLDYRWGTTQTMANDILRGLHSDTTDAVAP